MATKDTRYIEATGRRKTATARVRITPQPKMEVTVNGKAVDEYFPTATMRMNVLSPFNVEGVAQNFLVSVHVYGGGISSQSEAVRDGVARALTDFEATLRKSLKAEGYLKRDPRMKERRKFGLRKARRAPQWSKR
jgi:small subunit ribosomal protein S9